MRLGGKWAAADAAAAHTTVGLPTSVSSRVDHYISSGTSGLSELAVPGQWLPRGQHASGWSRARRRVCMHPQHLMLFGALCLFVGIGLLVTMSSVSREDALARRLLDECSSVIPNLASVLDRDRALWAPGGPIREEDVAEWQQATHRPARHRRVKKVTSSATSSTATNSVEMESLHHRRCANMYLQWIGLLHGKRVNPSTPGDRTRRLSWGLGKVAQNTTAAPRVVAFPRPKTTTETTAPETLSPVDAEVGI